MFKKYRGFTLIELLAVIVIIGIILLVVFPVVTKIIEEAEKGSFRNSVYGIVKSAEYKHADNLLKNKVGKVSGCGASGYEIYTYNNGLPVGEELSFKGQRPKSGTIAIQSNGDVAVAVHNGKWCAIKNSDDSKIEIYDDMNESECEQMLPSGGEGYIDVKSDNTIVTALTCNGEVMIGPFYDLDNLIKVEEMPKIEKIYKGNYYLAENNEVYQLNVVDDGSLTPILTGEKLLSDAKEVFVTDSYNDGYNDINIFFLLNTGEVMAMGPNDNYQLGLGTEANDYYEEPVKIPGLSNVKTMAVSLIDTYGTILALLEDGTVKAWGYNIGGAPTDYSTDYRNIATSPQIIPDLTNVTDIVTSGLQSFAILDDHTVKVWGYDDERGLLAMGGYGYIETPTLNPNLTDVKSIFVDGDSSILNGLAIKNNGDALIWGLLINLDEATKQIGSNMESGLISGHKVMMIDKNSNLHVWGQNEQFSLCPGVIKKDGTCENHVIMAKLLYMYGVDEVTYSKVVQKLQLKEEHSTQFQPLIQCLKNSNSPTDFETCWTNHDQDKDIHNILSEYYLDGKPILEQESDNKTFLDCAMENQNINDMKENCMSKLSLNEKHSDFTDVVACMNDANNEEEYYGCYVNNSEEFMMSFMNILQEYDYDGNYIANSDNICLPIYPFLTKLNNLNNVQVIDFDLRGFFADGETPDLTVGIANYQLFAWGYDYFLAPDQ
ncbi:MAG: prepilin-type N-terminal cleavage/methylation domain-containing protein [Bacilli bacterium]|nr:prepilin-type N-terminal cleavage/methylation domain-containing protein [Bacilli bacterium]